MTYNTFLAKLRETPRDWQITPLGAIRRWDGFPEVLCCPITAVAATPVDSGRALDVAKDIKLPQSVTNKVIAAADGMWHLEAAVRRDLLAACGLEEAR